MPALSTLIQKEIRHRGWTMRELAERAKLSHPTISKILADSDRIPELDTLAGLAEALDIPLRRLIEACGFAIDSSKQSDWRERAQAMLTAVPELQPFLDPIASLSPDDREALLVYVESLYRQRRRKG